MPPPKEEIGALIKRVHLSFPYLNTSSWGEYHTVAKDNRVARGGVVGADRHRQAKVLDSSVEAPPGLQRWVLLVLERSGLGHVTILEAIVGVAEVSGRGLVVPVFGFITLDQRQALLDGGQEIVRGINGG